MPSFNPERLNIKDLTIEEPESREGLPFDPEKEITEEDWGEIKEELERGRDNADLYEFVKQAAEMKILDPEVEIRASDEEKIRMYEKIDEWWKQYGDGLGVFSRASFLKILYPEVNLGLPKAPWESIKKLLENSRGNSPSNFLSAAVTIKLCDPNFNIDIDQETKELIEEKLKSEKETDIFRFANTAKNLKIIDSDINLGLDVKTWENLKNELDIIRRDDYYDHHKNPYKWRSFCELAVDMKILATEKVEVTDKGLEITMPGENKLIESEASIMPKKRNF